MQHKKSLTLLIVFVLIVASNLFTVGAQDNGATISVLPDVSQVTAGQEFTVNVQVTNADQIYGVHFQLAYDPTSFQAVATDDGKIVSLGSFFGTNPSTVMRNIADDQTGLINYDLTLMNPAPALSGDGVVGTVKFRALKDGSTAITSPEANLVSPVFTTDANGQKTVQKMNHVPVQITQGVAPAVNAPAPLTTSNTASVAASAASASVSSNADATSMFSNPALNNQPAPVVQPVPVESSHSSSQLPLIIAGVFFALGLGLLTVSVGLYSRMRMRFNMMALTEIHPEQVF